MPLYATLAGTFGYGRPQRTQGTNSLIYLDAGVATSYPGTGVMWSNLGTAGPGYRFTLANSPTFSTIVVNGTRNSTLSFDGVNDYASPSTSLLTLAQANSWAESREYWVYWRGSPGCLTSENGTPVPDTSWYDAQAAMSNTNLTFSVWQGSLTAYTVYSTLTSNVWNHIVWQHNKSTNTLMAYVNGTQTYSNAAITRTTPDSAGYQFYTILCAPSATNFGAGSASYLGANLAIYRWYNRILTAAEISTTFATEKDRFGVAPPVITAGIILHLDAGNSSSYPGSGTTWTDLTGNARNATLVNSPTYNSSNGGYFTFVDTLFQHATIANFGDIPIWTIEAWARPTVSLSGKVTAIFCNQFNGASKLNFSIGTNQAPTSYNICTGFYNGQWRTTTGFAPALNTWYQIVGTYDGSIINQYVNGALSTTTTYNGNPQTGGEIRIARRWDDVANSATNFFGGDIAVIRLYSTAMTAAQVLQNYNANKARFGF
jgi:hypothetical protein